MSQPTLCLDAQGRCNTGNPGGTRNPFHRHTANLRKAFVEAFTPEDMVKVASKIFYSSLRGNMTAARMVLQYCIGKPGPAVDPDTAEGSDNHGESNNHGGHGERQEVKKGETGTVDTVISAVVETKEPRGHGVCRQVEKKEVGTVETAISVNSAERESPDGRPKTVGNGLPATAILNGA